MIPMAKKESWYTPPETNIASENPWLEKRNSFCDRLFSKAIYYLSFRDCSDVDAFNSIGSSNSKDLPPHAITVANNRLVGILLKQKVLVVTVDGWGVNPSYIKQTTSLCFENIRVTGRCVPQILLS